MNIVYLSIGSNLGDRYTLLQQAISSINNQIGKVISVSPIYESEPFGFDAPEKFLNACVKLETKSEASDLLTILQEIEVEHGRIRVNSKGYSSRTLDLDIIFFNDLILDQDTLKIPHPHYHKRQFVLRPLNDIASNFTDPRTFLTVNQLLLNCQDASDLTKYKM